MSSGRGYGRKRCFEAVLVVSVNWAVPQLLVPLFSRPLPRGLLLAILRCGRYLFVATPLQSWPVAPVLPDGAVGSVRLFQYVSAYEWRGYCRMIGGVLPSVSR